MGIYRKKVGTLWGGRDNLYRAIVLACPDPLQKVGTVC